MLSFPIYFLYIGNIFLLFEIDSGMKIKLLSYSSKLELSKVVREFCDAQLLMDGLTSCFLL